LEKGPAWRFLFIRGKTFQPPQSYNTIPLNDEASKPRKTNSLPLFAALS
jgi:hypothetical protein